MIEFFPQSLIGEIQLLHPAIKVIEFKQKARYLMVIQKSHTGISLLLFTKVHASIGIWIGLGYRYQLPKVAHLQIYATGMLSTFCLYYNLGCDNAFSFQSVRLIAELVNQ